MISQNNKIVNSFSDRSFENEKREEEFFEDYNASRKKFKRSSEEQLLRRWLLKFVRIPNAVGSLLREWLRETPGSRGSTIDKGAGTHTFEKGRIQKTGNIHEYDKKYRREHKNDRKDEENGGKKNRALNYRCSQKNHHVYHVYKQNETKVQSYVEEKEFENIWLARDEIFPGNSVLVLPRIQPKSEEKVLYPRTSKTIAKKQLITRCDGNPKNWEPLNNWRKDSNDFSRNGVNVNRENEAKEEFGQLEKVEIVQSNISCETISLRLRLDFKSDEIKSENVEKNEMQYLELGNKIDKKNYDALDHIAKDKNEEKENDDSPINIDDQVEKVMDEKMETMINNEKDENITEKSLPDNKEENKKTNKREYQNFPVMSSLTQKKMDDLLKSLRERINALEHEEKPIDQFERKSRQINLETGTYEKSRYLSSHCQDKSGSLANYVIPIGSEARPSFAERIQEIWVDHKSQWTMVGENKRNYFFDMQTTQRKHSESKIKEQVDEEVKKIHCLEPAIAKQIQRRTKSKLTATDRNFEIFKPIICHVGVQYESNEFKNQEKSFIFEFEPENKCEPSLIEIKNGGFEGFSKMAFEDEKKEYCASKKSSINLELELPQKNYNPSSSSSEDSVSKVNSLRSRSRLNYWERKKLKMVLPKIELKSLSNLCPSILHIPKRKRDSKKELPKKNWFSITIKRRWKMKNYIFKWFDKSAASRSRSFGKLAHGVKNIFSCIEKKSVIDVNEDLQKIESPSNFSSNSIEELEIDKIKEKSSNEIFGDTGRFVSSIERNKDFSLIEYPEKMDPTNKSYGSMTKLSVTTSNSTNITLQLLGSTSDTRNVPSDDLRVNLAPCLVESRTEIVKTDLTDKLKKKVNLLNFSPAEIKNSVVLNKFPEFSEKKVNFSKTMIDATKKNRESSAETTFESSKKIMRKESERKMKRHQMSNKDCSNTRTETLAKRVISKPSSSSTEKNFRLQRRKSVIDIKVDKLSSEQTKKVNVPNGQTQRSKYLSRPDKPMGKIHVGRDGKIGESLRSKQRIDSPIIPRKATKTFQSRGRSSHIPISVDYMNIEKKKNSADSKIRSGSTNLLNFSPPSLANILNDTLTSKNEKCENPYEKLNGIETKNNFASSKSSEESRTILKNPLSISLNTKSKRFSENRVHFDFNNVFSIETTSRAENSTKKRIDDSSDLKKKSSAYDRKIDDRRIVKRIQSSLETGVPLKRITITDPHVVTKKNDPNFSIFQMDKFVVLPEDESLLNPWKEMTANKSLNRMSKKKLASHSYRQGSTSRRRILSRTLEKCNSNEIAISYRALEKKHSDESNKKSEEKETENLSIIEKSERSLIVDLTRIKEKLDYDIIERTSRTSGTEDNDCAIILIKAINSSMQLSDD